MSHAKELQRLISKEVMVDVEYAIDEVFAEIASDKNATLQLKEELEELREFKGELEEILKDLQDNKIDENECKEIIDDIMSAREGEF